jgi:MFS transporter, Spinster family, sphingosine-1-phosphate transporter
MRMMSMAVIYLIGMGAGPLAAGVLRDVLRPFAGEQSLRFALLLLCPGYLWAAWHMWRASGTVARDIQGVQHEHARRPGIISLSGELAR